MDLPITITFDEVPAPMENVPQPTRDFSGLGSPNGQASPVPTSNRPSPVQCPECGKQYGRPQELQRHMLSSHLPFFLHCPHSPCPWRGNRREDFRAHLRERHAGSDPKHDLCFIYDTKMVLDWIRNGSSAAIVANIAVGLVSQKAHELGLVEEWEDLWGRQGRRVQRPRGWVL
ncbi:hypothetical protein F5148DRAFT_1149748 [Russula earlei]|uniref:Uncharacterized protein n=1 Tax=Russula earlei TaxID=71964 RepID=A0ACC0U8A4_9AGAM|nr:hypothetical protein F5148DRAFT_1149748 [Russula earlei]